MSDTRDREIAELEARILELRSKPAAPEPAPEPAAVQDQVDYDVVDVDVLEPEPEPPGLPAFMRGYPEPAPGPVLLRSASNEAPVLHPAGHAGLGAAVSN